MMNKRKSANIHLMRFVFVLPILVVVLLAFRGSAIVKNTYLENNITDTIPAATPKIEERADIKSNSDLFREKGIKAITIQKNVKARVTLNNGKVKEYNLNIPGEREAFEREYGDITPPSPPLPPPLPAKLRAPRPVDAPAGVVPVPPAPLAPPAPPKPITFN